MGATAVLGPAGAMGATEALVTTLSGAVAGDVAITAPAAGFLAPLVAPLAGAGAAGPFGWVIIGGAVMSGIVIVAGDEDTQKWNCWEHVLRIDEADSAPIPESRIETCRQHGMLLTELASHCEVLKTKEENDEPGKLILKNQHGEYFAFSVSLVVPAGTYKEGYNATHDITVVHAVKAQLV